MIAGLTIIPHFVSSDEEDFILAQLDAPLDGAARWGKERGQRPIQQYGARYDYGLRTLSHAPEIPTWLLPFCHRVAHCTDGALVASQVIANDYPDPESSIACHVDHQRCFGAVIASLSLLSSTVMLFRRGHKGGASFPVLLEPRSLLVLQGEARYEWYHELEPGPAVRSIDLDIQRRRRVSVTFRSLAVPVD